MSYEEELNRDEEPPHLMAAEESRRAGTAADQTRRGSFVLRPAWRRVAVSGGLAVAVLAIVLIALAVAA